MSFRGANCAGYPASNGDTGRARRGPKATSQNSCVVPDTRPAGGPNFHGLGQRRGTIRKANDEWVFRGGASFVYRKLPHLGAIAPGLCRFPVISGGAR